jgi:hypothetical protein
MPVAARSRPVAWRRITMPVRIIHTQNSTPPKKPTTDMADDTTTNTPNTPNTMTAVIAVNHPRHFGIAPGRPATAATARTPAKCRTVFLQSVDRPATS